MPALLRFIICFALSLSLGAAVVPLQAAVAQPERASCCAKMKMDDPQNDCAKHMPKSHSEQQCCAACVIGLAAFIGGTVSFSLPAASEESFASFPCDEHVRSERPPVPPPRSALV